MNDSRDPESMITEAMRIIAITYDRGEAFAKANFKTCFEKVLRPTMDFITSNNLTHTRFYAQFLERFGNLSLLTGIVKAEAVLDLLFKSCVDLRMITYGKLHASLLMPLWNIFALELHINGHESGKKAFYHIKNIIGEEGVLAFPGLHDTIQNMNKAMASVNGEPYVMPIQPFTNGYISSRDNSIMAFLGDPSFDIYKMYFEHTGKKVSLVTTMSMIPRFSFYSLPTNAFEEFYSFALNFHFPTQAGNYKVIFIPGYANIDHSLSPFYEITVHDTKNHRLLLPKMDGKRIGLSLPGCEEIEWFDYLFDNDFDLNGPLGL